MKSDWQTELETLLADVADNALTSSQADRLRVLLRESPEAVQFYLEWMDNHEALSAIYPGDVYAASLGEQTANGWSKDIAASGDISRTDRFAINPWWAIAAGVLVTVGLGGYLIGVGRPFAQSGPAELTEQKLAGHAMLRRTADLVWTEPAVNYREGDVLPAESLRIRSGVAEIDFFCGATLIVEGPAELTIQSDWSAVLNRGRIRANVPPAARGFILHAADSEIVDLGTEFALEVQADSARVEVIDGEVELRGGQHDGQHLVTGERRWLRGDSGEQSFSGLSTLADLQRRRLQAEKARYQTWKQTSLQFRTDPRLIAYFPVAEHSVSQASQGRFIDNRANTGASMRGKLVGPVQFGPGRFGDQSAGVEFDRTGSRVRTRIDGQFAAFTFAAWVRIDSLEHRYNALFMSDGYENGEPHWQIQDDGRLMFSVMVDDTPGVGEGAAPDARLHRIYYTDPIWDVSMSGQWFHLAVTYDPAARMVVQYVDSRPVSREEIVDKFFVSDLRIGPAELGNWGQPLRKSPWFAVRNLNGTIDELAIYDSALAATEISQMYQQGKPIGY